MTSNGSASYVYDAENRLIATAGYSYIYDGDGERVENVAKARRRALVRAVPRARSTGEAISQKMP